MLDRFFALNRVSNIVEALGMNQSFQAVVFGKSVDKSLTMFEGAPRQVARDPDDRTPLRRLVMK